MDLIKYLTVLVVFLIEDGDTGGHGGGKHHDHVRLHMPEFIHHDHHTKVITIHHHHHKPKKEHHHHHHHHHHPKPHVPHGHHYQKHHTKLHTTTKTVSKGKHHKHHGHHGHHGHSGHHGHHGHHGSHGHHHGHDHGHHGHHDNFIPHDTPSYNYEPPATTFEEDFASFSPAVSAYGHIAPAPAYGGSISQTPRVHGVSHTVKQVNVYDSLPGVIPGSPAKSGHGYEVTEAEEDGDDVFTSVNSLQQSYPGTYNFVGGVAPATHDSFGEIPQAGGLQAHDPFAAAPQPTSAIGGVETFTGGIQPQSFASSAPAQGDITNIHPSPEFPTNFQGDDGGFGSTANTFSSADDGGFGSTSGTFAGGEEGGFGSAATFVGATGGTAFASDDDRLKDDSPVTFSRVAGVQQTVKTGGVETIVY